MNSFLQDLLNPLKDENKVKRSNNLLIDDFKFVKLYDFDNGLKKYLLLKIDLQIQKQTTFRYEFLQTKKSNEF